MSALGEVAGMSDDITQVARDDALFEALIRDEAPPADDELAGMLAAWRSDLLTSSPSPSSDEPPVAPLVTLDRARRRRRRALIMVVTAVVGIGAGTSAAAASAGPDSPLWPITQVLYPDLASSRVAEQEAETSIDKAREAIAQQRYADAEQLLNQAAAETAEVTEPGTVERLLGEIAAVKGLLPGFLGGDPGRSGGNPSGGTSNPTTGPSPGATGGPAPTATSGGILPPLPLPPLPSLLPSLPIPLPPLPLLLDLFLFLDD